MKSVLNILPPQLSVCSEPVSLAIGSFFTTASRSQRVVFLLPLGLRVNVCHVETLMWLPDIVANPSLSPLADGYLAPLSVGLRDARNSIGGLYSELCLSVSPVAYCGQTVQDRHTLCTQIE